MIIFFQRLEPRYRLMDQEQRQRPSRKPMRSDEAYQKLIYAAHDLRIRASLMPCQRRRVLEASAVLQEPQASPKKQQYRVFLYHVHARCGPHGVLLCACELGQHNVTTMRKADRAQLIDLLERDRQEKLISCSIIHQLAREHGVPASLNDSHIQSHDKSAVMSDSSRTGRGRPHAHNDSAREDVHYGEDDDGELENNYDDISRYNNNIHDDKARLAALNDHEYPSMENFVRVFGAKLGACVRRISERGDSNKQQCSVSSDYKNHHHYHHHHNNSKLCHYRAAVAFAFTPDSNKSTGECLVSLDLQDWAVGPLAWALFGVKTQAFSHDMPEVYLEECGGQARTVGVTAQDKGSIAVTTWGSDLILKSVRRGALLDVLGPELDCAIQASCIRKAEVGVRKEENNCVSMILTASGAILNLILSRKEGMAILRKLSGH
ncbi:hypothetical protein MN608_10313 [Microdochium nivale]|nr:hypothetical protein MN608_10313 [Microdochium nivale]